MSHRSALAALSVVCAFSLGALGGCRDTTSPSSSSIVGSWATAPEDLQPNGWYEIRRAFTPIGTYRFEARMYGVYPGQPRNELSAYSVIDGNYRVAGDSLFETAHRETTWDRFYGANSPPTVRDIPDDYWSRSRSRFAVQGSTLVLDYFSYPADAPVPTQMILQRIQ